MSSFGDESVKTRIEEWLSCIFQEYYGKRTGEATAEEKLQFENYVLEVLNYMFGEWLWN